MNHGTFFLIIVLHFNCLTFISKRFQFSYIYRSRLVKFRQYFSNNRFSSISIICIYTAFFFLSSNRHITSLTFHSQTHSNSNFPSPSSILLSYNHHFSTTYVHALPHSLNFRAHSLSTCLTHNHQPKNSCISFQDRFLILSSQSFTSPTFIHDFKS